jgi:uncharacterized repeat protein (TIGR03803 family)
MKTHVLAFASYLAFTFCVLGQSNNLVINCTSNKIVQCGTCSGLMAQPAYTLIYAFNNTNVDGHTPISALLQPSDGAVYSTTEYGGSNGVGTVFKMNTDGSGYVVLHHFASTGIGGQQPGARLLQGADGMLYCVTAAGGSGGGGTVFNITTLAPVGSAIHGHKRVAAPCLKWKGFGCRLREADGAFHARDCAEKSTP